MAEKEPVVIDEVVTLDMDDNDFKNTRTDFASVVFHNMAETYPEDAHIECKYTVTSDLVPTTRDYVALYKVGWMSPRDYIYYEWAPIPKEYKVGCDADSSVLFPAHKLPKDDGEFYQFCYVSSSNQIRGASTPFQFRRPGADDFVEIDDEETNMLVIRSKTIYLEENLQQAQAQRQKLIEAQDALQKERDTIITKYQEVKNQLVTLESEHTKLKGHLSTSESKVEQLKTEARDMTTVRDELQTKIDKLNKEKVTLNEKISSLTSDLDAANTTIASVTAELKVKKKEVTVLQTEKDELSGRNAQLEEEAEMFKKHVQTSETTVDQYSKQSEALQMEYAQQESLIDHLRQQVEKLSTELEDNRRNLDSQTAVNIQDKERLEEMVERLKNAEDKLMAAEESKVILQKEITTFEVTQHEMSRQIEKSKTECESLKKKLVSLEEDFTQKTEIQAAEMEQTLNDVLSAVQEKEKLQKENGQLKQSLRTTLERSGENHGSMTIMKQSLTQIKERLEKRERQCKSLEKQMKIREDEMLERERENRREIEDLKEKIYMCGEEYKALYIEKNKLQKKLDRILNKRKLKYGQHEKVNVAEPVIETNVMQRSAPVSEAETEVDVPQDLLREIENLEETLDKKVLKKNKYKQLYKELQEARLKEAKEKDAEIASLKKRLREPTDESDLKIRALQKCVTEKEQTIEELNFKLRSYNQGCNDETGASMLPRGPGFLPQEGKYPYHEDTINWSHMHAHQGPIQYPHPPAYLPQMSGQVPPMFCPYPLQYPAHGPQQLQCPPVPPRTNVPVKTDQKKNETVEDLTVLESRRDSEDVTLEAPIQPLPPPIQPVRLPSAKLAAVKSAAAFDDIDGKFTDAFCCETDLKVKLPGVPSAPLSASLDLVGPDIKEDRFYDAEGSSMKLCPDCNKTFPADVDEQVMLEHQVSHMGTMCPQCMMLKPDNMTDDDFTRHVNQHYDEEESRQLV
ncbi:tax1-binding protein 1 homolog [Ruditapes philippinarum]|uniref:tax1-binding protein 1 homolog n=1 Tax=Ruditapes philippinarum TaxID=129788 RepID=UPI00295A61D5|nr:tax1-binding protein 1 homolog [Ruditapes philippinarum]XP_060573501.1 tax1-binding protein 1 homolog [Ruditapes philippinarum]